MTKNIILIGAGNLGSRHLQSLAVLPSETEIHVVDPSQEALNIAQERWEQVAQKQKILFHQNTPNVKDTVDWVIIASNANVRAKATLELLEKNQVQNIIFEKVLFQKLSDFDEVQQALNTQKTKAWVNCTRRAWPVYQEYKSLIGQDTLISLHVSGSDWGLGCNSIHMLDLCAYLSGTPNYQITGTNLDPLIHDAKREGFKEFTGSYLAIFENGSRISIESLQTPDLPYTLSVKSSKASITVHEDLDYYDLYSDGAWERKSLKIPYQSELTGNIILGYEEHKHMPLTPINESSTLHKPLLEMLLEHYNTTLNTKEIICPIT